MITSFLIAQFADENDAAAELAAAIAADDIQGAQCRVATTVTPAAEGWPRFEKTKSTDRASWQSHPPANGTTYCNARVQVFGGSVIVTESYQENGKRNSVTREAWYGLNSAEAREMAAALLQTAAVLERNEQKAAAGANALRQSAAERADIATAGTFVIRNPDGSVYYCGTRNECDRVASRIHDETGAIVAIERHDAP